MDLFSQKLKELEGLDVPSTKKADFDEFWSGVLKESGEKPLHAEERRIAYPFQEILVDEVVIDGIDGTPVFLWFLRPKADSKIPVIIHFHGYGESRGLPFDYAHWLLMGCAVIAPDFRMQGGTTGSRTGFTGSSETNLYAFGIGDKETYYHKFIISDALRAVDYAWKRGDLDKERIIIDGNSQGGGIALTVAGLSDKIALCLADVPGNSWFEKRLLDRTGSMASVSEKIRKHPDQLETILNTLSYFDNINFAESIQCPVLVSTALHDGICPPETVFATYNKIKSKKEISVYPCGEHDGGGPFHTWKKMEFIDGFLNSP